MEKSIFKRIGDTYHQEYDYFLPDLLPPENISVSIWGQRRKRYLLMSVKAKKALAQFGRMM